MSQRTYPQWSKTTDEHAGSPTSRESSAELLAARRLSDKASLLRPLQDEHLL
jgi:hypothetical protein